MHKLSFNSSQQASLNKVLNLRTKEGRLELRENMKIYPDLYPKKLLELARKTDLESGHLNITNPKDNLFKFLKKEEWSPIRTF